MKELDDVPEVLMRGALDKAQNKVVPLVRYDSKGNRQVIGEAKIVGDEIHATLNDDGMAGELRGTLSVGVGGLANQLAADFFATLGKTFIDDSVRLLTDPRYKDQ